jgi:hypothetical protein
MSTLSVAAIEKSLMRSSRRSGARFQPHQSAARQARQSCSRTRESVASSTGLGTVIDLGRGADDWGAAAHFASSVNSHQSSARQKVKPLSTQCRSSAAQERKSGGNNSGNRELPR